MQVDLESSLKLNTHLNFLNIISILPKLNIFQIAVMYVMLILSM